MTPLDDTQDIVEVTVLTRHQALTGWLYLPKTAKPGRALSELINGTGRRFLALKNVEIVDRVSGKVAAFLHGSELPNVSLATTQGDAYQVKLPPGVSTERRSLGPVQSVLRSKKQDLRHPFLQVNIDAIEMLIPHAS
jgi:hypothetical protein